MTSLQEVKQQRKSEEEACLKYIAESIKKGEFLPSHKVGKNLELDYTQHFVRDHWENGFNHFRLSCLALALEMTGEERREFVAEYEIYPEKMQELLPEY